MPQIPETPRVLLTVPLQPLQGRRFQPTGFPDLGAATFRRPGDGFESLLVESAQSVANRMEAVCWDGPTQDLVSDLKGLGYVRVEQDGAYLTSSITAAHRLNAVQIASSDCFGELAQDIGLTVKGKGYQGAGAVSRQQLAKALYAWDPSSLIHGVFLEKLAGVLRVPRMLSGFIEAENVAVAASGGVKMGLEAATEAGSNKTAKEGYGHVPFHRDEYTAQRIHAYFNIDLHQLRGYGLDKGQTELLYALAVWKIRSFLEGDLRLRTACDLEISGEIQAKHGYALPTLQQATADLAACIKSQAGAFKGSPKTVTYSSGK